MKEINEGINYIFIGFFMLYFDFIRLPKNEITTNKKIYIHHSDDNKLITHQDSDEYSLVIGKKAYSHADLQDLGYLCGSMFPAAGSLYITIDAVSAAQYPLDVWITWLSFGLALSSYKYTHTESPFLNIQQADFAINTNCTQLLQAFDKGVILAKSQLIARELMNKPSNIIYPISFIEAVKGALSKQVLIDELDEKEMQALGFGGLLAIAQGSENPARLLKMEYNPVSPKATLVLVGKGVTFDSGGISIKQPRFMSTMKTDMGGAAAVVGAINAIAMLEIPLRVIGLCGLVENMPSGKAIKPGDVVTMHSGKFVEIISTDAEGRMILADVLDYAEKTYKPDYLVDIATLTGATGISLGKAFASLMGNDSELIQIATAAGASCAEHVWHMPIAEDLHEKELESDFADFRHGSEGSDASASVAATFLNRFVPSTQKWIHIDSAAMSLGMQHRHIYPSAASGFGVLLLNALAEKIVKRLKLKEE